LKGGQGSADARPSKGKEDWVKALDQIQCLAFDTGSLPYQNEHPPAGKTETEAEVVCDCDFTVSFLQGGDLSKRKTPSN
jgi:hypothetical protein